MKIEIVSGEGESGTVELFAGKHTVKAIRARLTRERCGDDRWAYVRIDGRYIADENLVEAISCK